MHLSPAGADDTTAYEDGWRAVNRLLRQGFSWSGNERNAAFLNAGEGAFPAVGALTGLDYLDDGRAAARADWDLDGDEDLLVVNRTGPRLRLLRNDAPRAGSALQLRLEGRDCNRDAIGARVEVLLGGEGPLAGRRLVQTRRSSEGYLAQPSAFLHFGLGAAPIERITVRWPDGSVDFIDGLEPGRHVLVQGDVPRPAPRDRAPVLQPSPILPAAASETARVLLPEPVPVPRLEVESSDGRSGTLFGVGVRAARVQAGDRPLLVNLWASWCAPCAEELQDLASAAEALRAAGLDVLALSVDAFGDRDAAEALLKRVGWPFPAGYASPQAAERLDALQGAARGVERRMPIPTSLLIDTRGQAIALYVGPVTAEQVLADLALLEVPPAERLAAALPFPGRWRTQPDGATLVLLKNALDARGLPDAAAEFLPGVIHLEFGRARLEQGRPADAEQHFRAALDADGEPLASWSGLAYALQLQDKHGEAAEAYRSALRWAPDDEGVLYNLGIALLAADRRDEAEDVAARLRQLGSRFAPAMDARLRDAR